jgi:prophage DNA circulation protein
MNWIKSFLGMYDKRQAKKTIEVAEYVDSKKVSFDADMELLRKQAQKIHAGSKQIHADSIELNRMVSDITTKVAFVTGGFKIVKKK